MAAENVNISLNIEGDYKKQIQEYSKQIQHAAKVVQGLKKSLETLAVIGNQSFNTEQLTKSLGTLQRVFMGLRNIKSEELQQAITALSPNKMRVFVGAMSGLRESLADDTATKVNALGVGLKSLGDAQKVLDGNNLAAQLKALSESLPRLKQAVQSDNFKNFAKDLGNIQVHTESVEAIVKLGAALKSIVQIGDKKTGLQDLAAGVRALSKIKETSGFLRNVSNIAAAGQLMHEMKPINFDKILKGLDSLSRIKLKDEQWDQIAVTSAKIKSVFADLRSVKLPNLLKFQEGVNSLNEYGAAINSKALKQDIAGVKEAIDQLSSVKMPNLGNLVKNLNRLSDEDYDFKKISEQVKKFQETLGQLHGVQVPSLTGFAKGLKEMKDISPEQFTHLNAAVKDLPAAFKDWDKLKLPNIGNFSRGLKDLASGDIDFQQVSRNLKSIPNALKRMGEIKTPDLSRFSKGIIDLSHSSIDVEKSTKAIDSALSTLAKYSDVKFKLPSLANFAKGLKELSTFEHSADSLKDKIENIKKIIESFKDLSGIKLPNIQGIANAIHKLSTAAPDAGTTAAEHISAIRDAVASLDKIRIPNLKALADGFRNLDTILPKGQDAANVGQFRVNMATIRDAVASMDKMKLPSLKSFASGFKLLNDTTLKYDWNASSQNVSRIKQIADEIKVAFAGFDAIKLPNIKGLAEGFRLLNGISLSYTDEGSTRLTANIHKLRQALLQLKDIDSKALPNVKNIADGLKGLANLGPIAANLEDTFKKVSDALRHISGVKVPNLKSFTEGFNELQKVIRASTGQMDTTKFAADMNSLANALGSFGKVPVPPNLAGFAKGIEAITKVNVQGFSKKFQELITEIDKFRIDPSRTMLDAFTAKLALAAAAIQQIDNRMRQAQAQFGSLGRAVEGTFSPLDRFSERIKMFLQYRVISTMYNKFMTWITAVPEQIREFEKAMYNVQSITGSTNSTIQQLGLTVKDIASTTKFSASEVADGMTMIAQAGFDAGQSMQMMQSISNLATGTLTDMKTTVDLVTSAMVVFNIEAHNSSRVSDVFANAVNKSKLTMDKIKTAFNYIGPVARDAGVSFEETAVAMMLLANSGQRASTIGTGLRNVFSTLLSPSKKLTDAANAAGVALVDLDPRVNSMKTVIENLALVVRDSSVALDVFGKRGSTAVLSLTNGLKDYDRLSDSVQRVGSASEMAAKQQEGLYVRWKNMHDRAQLVAVTLGENGLTAVIGHLIDKFSAFLDNINKANETMGGRFLIKATMLMATFTSFSVILAGIVKYFPLLAAGFKTVNASIAVMTARLVGVKLAADAAGTSIKTMSIVMANIGLMAVFTALSVAISYVVEKSKELENKIKDLSVELGRIKGQLSAFDDAMQVFSKAQEGTEEYANALRTVMTAFEENKGAVKGAEKEYNDLQKSIDALNGKFRNDGVKALEAYGEKLKQLQVEKTAEQIGLLYRQFSKIQRDSGILTSKGKMASQTQIGTKTWVDADVQGNVTQGVSAIFKADYAKSIELMEQLRAKAVDVKEVFQDGWFTSTEQNYAKWRDSLQQLTEGAVDMLNILQKAGQVSFDMSEASVRKLLHSLNLTEDQTEAVIYQFKQMQKAEFEGMFMKAIGPSLGQDLRTVTGELRNIDALYRKIGQGEDGVVKLDDAFAHLQHNIKGAAEELRKVSANVVITDKDMAFVEDIYKQYIDLYNRLEAAKEEHAKAILEIDNNENLSDHQKILHREERRRALAEKERVWAEQSTQLLKKMNNTETTAMLRRASVYYADIEKAKKAEEERFENTKRNTAAILGIEVKALQDKNSAELKAISENDAAKQQALMSWEAELERHAKTVEGFNTSMTKRMNDALRSPESADVFAAEKLKAFKLIEKRSDTALSHELSNIRKLEEVYIQHNGKLGISFKEARQMEQNAINKTYQELNRVLETYVEEIKEKYPNSFAEAIVPMQDKMQELLAKSEEKQIKLKDKNIKKEMALRSAAAKQIEHMSKEMHEAIKREQEKALHDIAVQEAQGVITHEKAEKEKAEASMKYLHAAIQASEAQIKALSQNPQMVAENVQQIQQLMNDIQKNQDEITKIRRKGIEDQVKIMHDGQQKLAEIEGKMGKGAFSAQEQARITNEYKAELERRKKLGEENAQALAEAETKPLDKVTQEVQKHTAKREEIQAKAVAKITTIEQDLAQKQEEFERKKLDIIKKYNAKREDLHTSLQDKLHNIETSDLSGEKKKQADIDYARSKRSKAMGEMDDAIKAGDAQALERISKELESSMSAFENADEPKKYLNEIKNIYEALEKVVNAQEEIEKRDAERKNNQEVDALTKKIFTANEAMEKSLAVEDERHSKTMLNMEAEANKIREQVALAEKLRDTYIESMSSDRKLPEMQLPKAAEPSRVPVNPNTFNGQVDALSQGKGDFNQALNEYIRQLNTISDLTTKGAAAFNSAWSSAMQQFVTDAEHGTELWYQNASGTAERLTAEQAQAFRANAEEWVKQNGNVYQSFEDTQKGVNQLAGASLQAWQQAFDEASQVAAQSGEKASEAVIGALLQAAGPAGQVIAQAIGDGAVQGGQNAQAALQQVAGTLMRELGSGISTGMEQGATDGIDRSKPILEQLPSYINEEGNKVWTFGQSIADATQEGVDKATESVQAWREVVLEDGKILYTNLTDAQREGFADMAQAAKDAAQENASAYKDMAQDAADTAKETGEEVTEALQKTIGDEGIKIPVEVDKDTATKSAQEVKGNLEATLKSKPVEIEVKTGQASVDKVRADVKQLFEDVKKDSDVEVTVKANTETASKKIASVIAMLEELIRRVYTVTVQAKVDSAISSIRRVQNELSKLKDKTITVTVRKKSQSSVAAATGGFIADLIQQFQKGGRVQKFADGGTPFRRLQSRFINRGSGNKDDVPALLMKNEFVHRAAAVRKYGLDFMYKLNNLELPASITRMFATGGLVSNVAYSIQKYATGGLVRSAKRKLEGMFAGSGVNLNVGNLNVVGTVEQAANNITSPLGVQALSSIAKSLESSVSHFAKGGPLSNRVLTAKQMQTISNKYTQVIAQARRDGNNTIARALSEEQMNLKRLSDSLKNNLDNLNQVYGREVQKLTEARDIRIAQKEREYRTNTDAENAAYSKRTEEDNSKYAKEDAEYNKSIAQLKSEYEKEIAELEKTLKKKKETAEKEEKKEAKQEEKTQRGYAKEDKKYEKATKDRADKYQKDLETAKKEYENAQFQYNSDLESKKQAVQEKQAEIENFKNQMASSQYPANSAKLRSASLQEVMAAHIAQTREENGGDEYIYALDLGGTIKSKEQQDKEEGKPPTDEEIRKLRKAIRARTTSEVVTLNKLQTEASRPPYSEASKKKVDDYNNWLNEQTGYNAWRRAVKAKKEGKPLTDETAAKPQKPRQSRPYREYLASKVQTDYQFPLEKANRELQEFLKAEKPSVAYNQKVAEINQEYKEATEEAKEARAEVLEQRKEHAEQLAEIRKQREEDLKQAQVDYDEGIAAAKEKYNTNLTETEENRKQSLAERETSTETRDKEHKEYLAQQKSDYDKSVEEYAQRYTRDMIYAKKQYTDGVDDMRSRYVKDVSTLRDNTQSTVDSAKRAIGENVSKADTDMKEELKGQDAAIKKAWEEKRDTYSTTKQNAEAVLLERMYQPSGTPTQQQAEAQATEKIASDAVMQTYKMSVDELIKRLSKGLWRFATGGLVPSTSTSKPNTDSVLSLLMPDEFVMSARAVRTFGVDFMNSINNLRLPAFAGGGIVEATRAATNSIRNSSNFNGAVNKTVHVLDLTFNNTHIGELTGESSVIDRFIGEMQRAKLGLGAMS